MLLEDRGGGGEGGERRAQLVTDVTGEPGVAFESFDQAAHHEVERFGELLDFLVGARHHQTSREFALGDQRRGFGDFEQGPNRAPGHPKAATHSDQGRQDRPRAHVEQQHAKGVFEVRQLEDLVDLGLHGGYRQADDEDDLVVDFDRLVGGVARLHAGDDGVRHVRRRRV